MTAEQTPDSCTCLSVASCPLCTFVLIGFPVCSDSTDVVEDDGIDNPFRPGGGLSREADIIVQMIKAGKQITPTSPTREDIRELEQELSRRHNDVTDGELEPSKSCANDVKHAATNGTNDPRTEPTTNFSPILNGNNNRPNSKPSSPKGSTGKSSTSPSESNSRDKNTLKKDNSCCVVQ